MPKIESIHADEILDSRGNPTVRATVLLTNGKKGEASVPSGASTGTHEAWELRDGDLKRYGGKGVKKAVRIIKTTLSETLKGMDVTRQRRLDMAMVMRDGTLQKKRLGANAILAVSLACARAAAKTKRQPLFVSLREQFKMEQTGYRLPTPTMNILNGGAHADWVMDLQEFMIVPHQKPFAEALRCGAEVFHALGELLHAQGYGNAVGDEGGYAVKLKTHEEGIRLIAKAVKKAGYAFGKDVGLAADFAASEFYNARSKKYRLARERKTLSRSDMIKLCERWVKKYPFVSLEDPLDQDDWQGWQELTAKMREKVVLVGDDLFATNTARLSQGIEKGAATAVLIKVNQIGTLSETMDAIALAQRHNFKISVSHRSGETTDDFIADLAVAVNADYVKFGSLSRSERLAKYNRLLEIEEEVKGVK